MFKEYGQKIIQVAGLTSAITVSTAMLMGNNETKDIMFYVMMTVFVLMAYVPFAVTGFIAKKNVNHITFFTLFALIMLAIDVYAKFEANASSSSTAGLVYIVMPVYLIGAALIDLFLAVLKKLAVQYLLIFYEIA